jgi:adenylate kinase
MPEDSRPVRALLLFGPPGSGKGTQAKLIMDCLGIPHISTGDMLRERMREEDELGRQIRSLVDAGTLVTDELADRMVEERTGDSDCAQGFILDGYPRTLNQARTMCRLLAERGIGWVVVHLKVDYNEIIGRLACRRHCADCGAVYNLSSNPPKSPEICDVCAKILAVRDDDREDVVRRRLEAYEAQTSPLVSFFAESGSELYEVSGSGRPPAAIAQNICELFRQE